MSQKITNNLFICAKQLGADNLVLSTNKEQLNITYYLPDEKQKVFFLPLKYLERIKKEILSLSNEVKSDFFEQKTFNKKIGRFNNKKISLNFLLSLISIGSEEKIIIDFKKDKKNNNWRLSELGLKVKDQDIIRSLLKKSKGLIILAGKKNNGKSSTLMSILNEDYCKKNSVCLLSDSWEKTDYVTMELNESSFELARKGDFDIIAIDEIKNKNHLSQAFRLASYGKLVLVTIEVENLKELAMKIKSSPWSGIEKKKLIKAISFQELVKLNRLINKSKDKRQEIASFKLLISQ